ncbi:MAG: nitroreductase family deazaflavin-dependent oxidoreductase [Myxococcales bacterium]|nr:nitroreductase family deazaflavin-dependent oxidoreductase [Myxococcales bacterium]
MAVSAPPIPWLIKGMTRVHMLFHKLSGGRLFNDLGGDDVCFVEMTGAKSGRTLTIPLMHVPYREGVLLVASQGGAPSNPAWFHNLVKNPDIEVTHRGRSMKLRARLATSDEKPALWRVCEQHYAPYAEYRTRTDRDIPIFVCEPSA